MAFNALFDGAFEICSCQIQDVFHIRTNLKGEPIRASNREQYDLYSGFLFRTNRINLILKVILKKCSIFISLYIKGRNGALQITYLHETLTACKSE